MRRLAALAAVLACGSQNPPVDKTPPSVIRSTPANHADNQPLSVVVEIDFDEPVVCGSVSVSGTDTPVAVTYSCSGAALTITPRALDYGTTYTVVASYADVFGNSAQCVMTFRTQPRPDTQAPTQPVGLTATPLGGRMELTWSPSTDDTGVAKYSVERDGAPLGETVTAAYSDSTAQAGRHYCYAVRALDAAGNASIPATTCADALDTQAPTTPADLTVTIVSIGRFDVAWSASTDDVGVAYYEVRGVSQGWTGTVALVETNAWTDTTLTPGQTYCYEVRACDAAQNCSEYSAQVCKLDDFAPPDPPTRVEAATGPEHVTVRWWDARDDAGVAGYDVLRDGVVAATTNLIAWTDDLAAGPRRCYTVVAFDFAGHRSGASAEACAEHWPRTYGGTQSEGALAVTPLSSGGYAVAGFSGGQAMLAGLAADGSLSWKKTYPYSRATGLVETADGFALAGWVDLTGASWFLLKTDAAGDVQWQQTYGGRATSLRKTADGGYIVSGYDTGSSGWVARTDASGFVSWKRTLTEGFALSVRPANDAFVAAMGSAGALVSLDGAGTVQWSHRYGDLTLSTVYDFAEGPGADLFAVALELDSIADQIWFVAPHLLRIDANGTQIWDKKIGAPFHAIGLSFVTWSIAPASDGFAIAGFTQLELAGAIPRFGSVLRTDMTGAIVWQSPDLWATIQAIAPTSDGGFVVAGYASTTPELYVAKLDANGAIR